MMITAITLFVLCTIVLVALQVPKVQWGDVGGLEGVKQRLKEAVQWPHLQPEALARLGAEPPKGSLVPFFKEHTLPAFDGT